MRLKRAGYFALLVILTMMVASRSAAAVQQDDFALVINPTAQQVGAGMATTFDLTAQAIGGFSQPINLTFEITPASSEITINSSSMMLLPDERVTITINTSAQVIAGDYMLAVSGRTDTLKHAIT